MDPDVTAMSQFLEQRFPTDFRRNSLSEEALSESTGPDKVPRVLVRMLTSLAMLLLSAIIVVGIHLHARASEPKKPKLLVVGDEANNLRKPDPRILDLTLGPPVTDTPTPHKGPVKTMEVPRSPDAHTTVQPLKEKIQLTTVSINLRNLTAEKTTQKQPADQTTGLGSSPSVDETLSATEGVQSPPVSNDSVISPPAPNDKDGTICPAVHKSFCNASGPAQFFYDPDEGSCVALRAYKSHVCNRSPNQFASLKDCFEACVKGQRAPEQRCVQNPRFVACTAVDTRGTWWFHDGRKCVPWSFLGGRCPLASAPVFDTVTTCETQCNDSRSRVERRCQLPASQLCEPSQLRLPFFAVPSVTDKGTAFQCHKVDWEFLLQHRCLLGGNAFVSRDECHDTCRRGTQKKLTVLQRFLRN